MAPGLRKLLLCALAASALGCATGKAALLGHCPGDGGYAWREVRSAHFRVKTNLDPAQAEGTTLELEKYRQVLLATWNSPLDPPDQVEVILYRDWSEFARFKNEQVLGYMSRAGDVPLLVVSQETPEAVALAGSTRIHELTHHLSYFFLVQQPRWLAEGLATYYSTMKLQRAGSEALVGLAPAVVLARLRSHLLLPMDTLWSWGGAATDDLYASSWLLVHYLINKQPERFSAFERRLAKAGNARSAWDEAFTGLSDEQLSLELSRYFREALLGRLPAYGSRVPAAASSALPEQRLLSDADFHAFQARLWMAGSSRATPEERRWYAGNELGEALRLEPEHLAARQLEIELTVDPRVRVALARTLVGLHPRSGRTWAALADALRVLGGADAERKEAVLRALALAPEDPQTLHIAALEYAGEGRAERALELSRAALARAPWSPERFEAHAAVLRLLGRCTEAATAERQALDILPETASVKIREAYVNRLFWYEQRCHVDPDPEGPDRLK